MKRLLLCMMFLVSAVCTAQTNMGPFRVNGGTPVNNSSNIGQTNQANNWVGGEQTFLTYDKIRNCGSSGYLTAQACIDSTPSGGAAYFPDGSYTGILISKPMTAVCAGRGAVIAGITIRATVDTSGIRIQDCKSVVVSGAGLEIDTTTAPISKLIVDGAWLEGPAGSIHLTNPTLADGFFTSWIKNNVLKNGIKLERYGDSITIEDNVISGSNIGFDGYAVTGSMLLVLQRNNITTSGGFVHLGGVDPLHPTWGDCSQVRILDNNMEGTIAFTGSNNSGIDIDGNTATPCMHTIIAGNKIAPVAAGIDGIRFNNAIGAEVYSNDMERASTAKHYRITASAIRTNIHDNEENPNGEAESNKIDDQGIGTFYSYKNAGALFIGSNAKKAQQIILQAGSNQVSAALDIMDYFDASGNYQWGISPAGVMGLGKNSFITQRDLAGTGRVMLSGNGDDNVRVGWGSDPGGANGLLLLQAAGAEKARINRSGQLLVGVTSPANTEKFRVNGSGYADSGWQGSSFSGIGTATFAAGAAAGTSPGTPTCTTSHVCDSHSGTVSFTMGTATTTGIALTVTTTVTRTNQANCVGAMYLVASPYTAIPIRMTETTTTVVFNAGTAPAISTAYELTYVCGGK